ncbi:MAG: TIGR00268 family protein, partial [Candidatus Electrothrix sp. AR4]|nr:TIGR00268 family protein [Candidatus Electrothrix sp. AR4]
KFFDLRPLSWNFFTCNTLERCYLCKRHMYSLFQKTLHKEGVAFLLDGTNSDDVEQGERGRPGLRAIAELGVRTPLADSGLRKAEIRALSRELGLDTCDLPSSSCLATRIPYGLEITARRLKQIADLERAVTSLGFAGCRARLDSTSERTVFLQLIQEDIGRFDTSVTRKVLLALLKSKGVDKIYLDLDGR